MNSLIQGSGGLQKVGAGTLTLTAANLYSGPTTLVAGTLVVANSQGSATGSSTVTLNGGILAAGPSGGTISGPVLAGNAAQTIAPGSAFCPDSMAR